jgi:T5SS/PEP-CTERM-associated repeat protein
VASRIALAAGVGALATLGTGPAARAVTTSLGSVSVNVNPGTPGGGNIAGPLVIGEASFGEVTLTSATGQNGGPSFLNITTGNITVGNSADGIGSLKITDFGTVISTSGTFDLVIGNVGTGNVQASFRSRINIADDLLMGLNAAASGTLLAADLGTVISVGDDATIGQSGEALVQLSNGARLVADAVVLGSNAGGDGRGTVTGFESLWRQSGSTVVGASGRGEFQVVSQGSAETGTVVIGDQATGLGVAVVNGSGTTWKVAGSIAVGGAGKGTLNVLDGAQLTMTASLTTARLAVSAGSEAHAIVSGVNSYWNAGTSPLTVGVLGFATLDVRSGGRMTTGAAILGDNVGSRGEVIVDGRGSVLEIGGSLDVGKLAEADLIISNSGLVKTQGQVRVAGNGRLSLAGGRLEIPSTNNLLNSGLVQGGGRIVGAVNNQGSGQVRTRLGDILQISGTLANGGLVELDGGEIEASGTVTNTASIDAQAAILRAGGTGLNNASGGQFSAIAGVVDVFGATANNAGARIVVGNSATLVFHDNLANSGQFFVFEGGKVMALKNLNFSPNAALSVQLGVFEEQQNNGQVQSAGAAALAGALAVTLAPGFTPELGDTFQLVTASGGVTGTFGPPSLPSLAGGLMWDLDYNPSSVVLSVVPGLTADFDANGVVNGADLTKWKTGFGKATGAAKADGDADGDGDVDGNDFLAWQRQVGMGTPTTASAAAVPEPGSAAMIGACAALAGAVRRRRSR